MDLNQADYISMHPTKHTAEQRKAAAAKAWRVSKEQHIHPATKRRAELVYDKLTKFEVSLPLAEKR